ncbi:helix-turn-helix domain-containing protein [Rhodococcus ruber]|uniref:helix-turn-helix domain-containing protein n=1 Tax=Rhodococcus ruber TaxID=1830 RepID=UPI00129024E7|nr:helix-turn-helix transcriptional regulator [Rhodococcus ruber]
MSAPQKKNPLGPTGRTVAANVKRIRTKHGLAYTELAARLEEVGRPIPTLGLRKIESEERRVDADDLLALSIALGVNPNALLFPPTSDPTHVVTITGAGMKPAADVWRWGRGEAPLVYGDIPAHVPAQNRIAYARAVFDTNSSPAAQDWTKDPNVSVVDWSGDGDGQ